MADVKLLYFYEASAISKNSFEKTLKIDKIESLSGVKVLVKRVQYATCCPFCDT
jgi:hypothetical protein